MFIAGLASGFLIAVGGGSRLIVGGGGLPPLRGGREQSRRPGGGPGGGAGGGGLESLFKNFVFFLKIIYSISWKHIIAGTTGFFFYFRKFNVTKAFRNFICF